MRSLDSIRAELEQRRAALARLKSGHGFRLGNGRYSQAEAQRRRKEILDLEMLAEYAEEEGLQ